MKTLRLIILMALTLSSAYTIEAQSKNELEATLKKCTIDKDSISEANKRLTTICDSLKKVATAYDTMYMVIKSKVLLKDFNPAQMNYLVDSLRQTGKDYAFGTLVTLNDSVSLLKMDNKRLNETIKKMNSISRPEKCLHLLINHPDINLHFKINPEYALQFFIFALPMKAEMSSAEEQLIRK